MINIQDFYIGKTFDAHTYFGAHLEKDGVWFRVYAPLRQEKVSLIGDFNQWQGQMDGALRVSRCLSTISVKC